MEPLLGITLTPGPARSSYHVIQIMWRLEQSREVILLLFVVIPVSVWLRFHTGHHQHVSRI